MNRHKRRPPPPAWTAFREMNVLVFDGKPAPIPPGVRVFKNSRYQVVARSIAAVAPFGEGAHLSIKRLDRAAVHDWRDLQRIKNEIVGPEAEAVEVYPAESRKTDTANQYHLWVFARYRFPFGQLFREVMGPEDLETDPDPNARAARQRPFDDDDPWQARAIAIPGSYGPGADSL